MSFKKIRCEECGAEIPIQTRFSHTITCRFCSTAYIFENETLSNEGVVKPFQSISQFKLGQTGTIHNKQFEIIGHLVLSDQDDIWDEWYVLLDDQPVWIEDSYDQLVLYTAITLMNGVPNYDEVMIGSNLEVNNTSYMAQEKGTATVIGLEGEFTGKVKPNEQFNYISGVSQNGLISIEYYDQAIKVLTGTILSSESITS